MESLIWLGMEESPGVRIGAVITLPTEALPRHICITGTTGSGKSTSACVLAYELARNSIPTIILDRTGEYADLLGKFPWMTKLQPGKNLVMALFQRDPTIALSQQV